MRVAAPSAEVDRARANAFGAGDRLPAPHARGRVPLVVGLDAEERPLDVVEVRPGEVGADGDDIELRRAAFGHAVVEGRADADARSVRRDRKDEAALDGSSGRVGEAEDRLALEEERRRLHFRQVDGDDGIALGIRLRRGVDRLDDALERIVLAAELVAGEGGERAGRADGDVAGDGEVRRGGAVEIARRDVDIGRPEEVERGRRGGKLEGQPFRLEILDEERRLGDGRRIRVAVEAEAPRAAHGAGRGRGRSSSRRGPRR